MPDPDLLTMQEVADYCRVGYQAVLVWISRGDLPAFKLAGSSWRIERKVFLDWLAASPVKPSRRTSGRRRKG